MWGIIFLKKKKDVNISPEMLAGSIERQSVLESVLMSMGV